MRKGVLQADAEFVQFNRYNSDQRTGKKAFTKSLCCAIMFLYLYFGKEPSPKAKAGRDGVQSGNLYFRV